MRRRVLLTILLTGRMELIAIGGLRGTFGTGRRPCSPARMELLGRVNRDLVTS
jgi:hypothetical protein